MTIYTDHDRHTLWTVSHTRRSKITQQCIEAAAAMQRGHDATALHAAQCAVEMLEADYAAHKQRKIAAETGEENASLAG